MRMSPTSTTPRAKSSTAATYCRVPLPAMAATAGAPELQVTLLVLGKREFCGPLSVRFARSLCLIPTDSRALEMLRGGARPTGIAQRQCVAVSTVRTQIGSVRAKTGAASIGELVRQIAVRPPLVGALRAMPAPGCI